jgi:hypothetical protein
MIQFRPLSFFNPMLKMKGHVSYERAPLRGYIYNPHFSFVIISFIFLFNIYIFIILNGFLHIPSILVFQNCSCCTNSVQPSKKPCNSLYNLSTFFVCCRHLSYISVDLVNCFTVPSHLASVQFSYQYLYLPVTFMRSCNNTWPQ